MSFILELVVIGGIVFVTAIAVTYLINRWILDTPSQPSGFEVKQNAGAMPVTLKQKDNDHG